MQRIVVAGGGYAGLQTALRVARSGQKCAIVVVDRNDSHQLITRLPELVGGRIRSDKILIPYRRLMGHEITHLQTDVTGFDPEGLAVETRAGRIQGAYLVIALGSSPDFRGIPGAAEHAYPVRSVSEGKILRQKLEQLVSQRDRVHVVIVGAGYTGTEVAGELAEWNRRLGGPPPISVTVVAPESGLLSEADPRLGVAAERILREKGVRFRLRHEVTAVGHDRVFVQPGEPCRADVVIWAARAHAAGPRLPSVEAPLPDGRIPVDPYLRLAPYDRVYLVGDSAAPYNFQLDRVAPASAQMAVEEGRAVGSDIAGLLAGREPKEFRARTLGDALALGGRDGVADVGGVILTGRPAIAIKQAALLRYLIQIGGATLAREYR
jgi:NADH dehydrogenase